MISINHIPMAYGWHPSTADSTPDFSGGESEPDVWPLVGLTDSCCKLLLLQQGRQIADHHFQSCSVWLWHAAL